MRLPFVNKPITLDLMWCLIAETGRIALLAASFILLARSLGPPEYGRLAATIAITAIIVPFCGWGGPNLIVKYVSLDSEALPEYIGNSIFYSVVGGITFSVVALGICIYSLQSAFSPTIFIFAMLSDVFLFRIVEMANSALQAVNRFDLAARVYLLLGISRFVAVFAHILTPWSGSATHFAFWYFVTSIAAAAVATMILYKHVGQACFPKFSRAVIRKSFSEGFPFSLGVSAKTVYSDIDKTMLTRMQNASVNGLYTAAYRTILMASVPIQAVTMATTTRFFKAGREGAAGTAKFARIVVTWVSGYGLATAAVLWLVAPIMPHLLGPRYAESVTILRWLALMPLVQGLHSTLGGALMGANRQGMRSMIQVFVAIVNIVANLILIRRFSWRGAVLSAYIAEGGLAVALFCLILYYARREKPLAKGLVTNTPETNEVPVEQNLLISLVVPSIGRAADLSALFETLDAQTYRKFEVIIVDQSRGDSLDAPVAAFKDRYSIRHIKSNERGSSNARNLGMASAAGDIISFPDDDCEYPPDLLSRIIVIFQRDPQLPILTVNTRSRDGSGAATQMDIEGGPITRTNVFRRCIEFSIFLRTASIPEDLAYFDETLGPGSTGTAKGDEGPDMLLRLMDRGITGRYDPKIYVIHPAPLDRGVRRSLKNSYAYGAGRGVVLRRHQFPASFIVKSQVRSIYGAMLMLFIGRPVKSIVYLAAFAGKFRGMMISGRPKSTRNAASLIPIANQSI